MIGSVDTSEFAVAVGASVGFLVGLGSERIDFAFAGALLAGGLIAAPIAAYLVKILPPRLLGAAVGGLIVLTNGRTLSEAAGASGEQVATLTVIVAMLWAASVAIAVAAVRREPEPADRAGATAAPAAARSRPARTAPTPAAAACHWLAQKPGFDCSRVWRPSGGSPTQSSSSAISRTPFRSRRGSPCRCGSGSR